MAIQAVAHGQAKHLAGDPAQTCRLAQFLQPCIHVAPVARMLRARFFQRMAKAFPFRGGGRVFPVMAGGGGQFLVLQAKVGLGLHHAAHQRARVTRPTMDRTMQYAQHLQQATCLAPHAR